MKFSLTQTPTAPLTAIPVFTSELGDPFLTACGFTAKPGQTFFVPPGTAPAFPLPGAPAAGLPAPEPGSPAILYGLGSPEALDRPALRRALAALARASRRFEHLAVILPACVPAPLAIRTAAESMTLALYTYTEFTSTADPAALHTVDLVTPEQDPAPLHTGQRLAEAVCLARDLVNQPGGTLTPAAFATRAAELAKHTGLDCEIWEMDRLAAEHMGGLLGVNAGSAEPARLVRLTYTPPISAGTIALVGKGVTFDSGGLSLKPSGLMGDMKSDMAGAAAVLAAMTTLRDLGCQQTVAAYLPLTDNMPGPGATRIGDVLRTRSGTTVEVLNTDAEGRLILADALALAAESNPDAIIDLATLTDAAPSALGRGMAAVLGTGPGWLARVLSAADRSGEPAWQLPLRADCRPTLDSTVADLVNHKPGDRHAGAILGALFLQEFVPDGLPWAHLDIVGCAWATADDGETTAGGTGYGVRLLAELLCPPPPSIGH
ncbi:leucyl aminopeptidase [Longispora albida]|uniref:leucyl aminopeptidase n=1 Tax=Longispora albida TaxID=203523 RepID=UPI0003A73D3D|nr:leucyl aminopeptidase [Longispora albida]